MHATLLVVLLLMLSHGLQKEGRGVDGRLTAGGLPSGRTAAVRGADFLHFTLIPATSVMSPSLPAPSVPSSSSSSSATHVRAANGRKRRKKIRRGPSRRTRLPRWMYSFSTESPFFTRRDALCEHTSVAAVRDDAGWAGLVRTIQAGDIGQRGVYVAGVSQFDRAVGAVRESIYTRRSGVTATTASSITTFPSSVPTGGPDAMFILFHGGPFCEWSRKFFRAWISSSRQLRAHCLVTLDAAADATVNYDLMVLGFPTIVRVRRDDAGPTFRGERKIARIIEWVVNMSGVAPLGSNNSDMPVCNSSRSAGCDQDDGVDRLQEDARWFGVEHLLALDNASFPWKGSVIDLREKTIEQTRPTNWPLVAANFVCVAHVVWWVLRMRKTFRKPLPDGQVHQDDHAHVD